MVKQLAAAPGSNCFCIASLSEMDERVLSRMDTVFFPLVQRLSLRVTCKTHSVVNVYGVFDDIHREPDREGWKYARPLSVRYFLLNPALLCRRSREALYCDDATTVLVDRLRTIGRLPSDVIRIIIQARNDVEPQIVFVTSLGVFASPVDSPPGWRRGGIALFALEPELECAMGGAALLEMSYTCWDGTGEYVASRIVVSPLPAVVQSAKLVRLCDGAFHEGMDKALVLQQLVSDVRAALGSNDDDMPPSVLQWWESCMQRHDLQVENALLQRIREKLKHKSSKMTH